MPLFCYPIETMNDLTPEKLLIYLKRYALVLIFLVLVLGGIFAYAFGIRFTSQGFVRAGSLVMTNLPEGTSVYTDQSKLRIARGGKVEIDLVPGGHTVIIDAPGQQPWNDLFTVTAGEVTTLNPLFVPKEPKLRTLTGEERAAAASAILAYALPTKFAPLQMAGGCALVYVAANRIVADATTTPNCVAPEYLLCPVEEGGARTEACPSSTVVFPPNEYIESVSPFPGRDDVLIVSAGSQAYVVELDPRAPQYFAPLVKGARVRSAPWSDTSIVYSDTKHVYEVPLTP